MATLKRRADGLITPQARTLTPPGVFLLRMLIFLTLIGFLGAILHQQLITSFMTNPGLNTLIITALSLGIIYAFRQVVRLYPEIRWVNAFRISDPGLAIHHHPVLLAPMATMLRDRTGSLSLASISMRNIMDSIASRLDEARDTGRYLVGLLVFLGLLGTFWGLLETMQSVGKAIQALDTKGEAVAIFDELKTGLAAPLKGMGTAFSSSLLGLAGSLILGFLELQANQAQNRFYNELEEWLSGITELTPGSMGVTDQASRQLTSAIYELQRVMAELLEKVGSLPSYGSLEAPTKINDRTEDSVKDLTRHISQMINLMRTEQKVVREWVDEQATQKSELTTAIKTLNENFQRRMS